MVCVLLRLHARWYLGCVSCWRAFLRGRAAVRPLLLTRSCARRRRRNVAELLFCLLVFCCIVAVCQPVLFHSRACSYLRVRTCVSVSEVSCLCRVRAP